MKVIKTIASMLLCCGFSFAHAQETGGMTINGEMPVKIGQSEFKARVSAAFTPSSKELHQGILTAKNFNLVIFDVPQSDITGKKVIGREFGTLGFSASKIALLKYDARSKTVAGEIVGEVNIPGYIDPKPRPIDNGKENDGHLFTDPAQQARIGFEIKLQEDLLKYVGVEKESVFAGEMKLTMDVAGDKDLGLRNYRVELTRVDIQINIGWYLEVANRLCVQPVRLSRLMFQWPNQLYFDYTGDGLPFGKPGAITEWKKADLVLSWKSWSTVNNASLWAFSQSESATLRSTVDDPECVEVFFVDTFSPSVFWGGGATYGSGTASAQIISTDQNADFGVDLTHLAHELGHAVSLCHPGDAGCEARAVMNPASTGTLMCPSGFNNDNPAINSTENESNVSNPLITFALKVVSAGPDCANDADCGACY